MGLDVIYLNLYSILQCYSCCTQFRGNIHGYGVVITSVGWWLDGGRLNWVKRVRTPSSTFPFGRLVNFWRAHALSGLVSFFSRPLSDSVQSARPPRYTTFRPSITPCIALSLILPSRPIQHRKLRHKGALVRAEEDSGGSGVRSSFKYASVSFRGTPLWLSRKIVGITSPLSPPSVPQ
jgi:hypothetical protein